MGVIRALVQTGANVNRADLVDKFTALHLAAQIRDPASVDIVRMLLQAGADLEATDVMGCSPLHCAVGNIVDVVRILIEAGADVNKASNDGSTPLFRAVALKLGANRRREMTNIVRVLVGAGADVGEARLDGSTPLHLAALAAAGAGTEIVRILIEAGADVNATDVSWIQPETSELTALTHIQANARTPLHSAVGTNNAEIVDVLLEAGADAGWVDKVGVRPQTISATRTDEYIVQRKQWTVLHLAVQRNVNLNIVRALLERGADLGAKDVRY